MIGKLLVLSPCYARLQWERPVIRGDTTRSLKHLFLLHSRWGPAQDMTVQLQTLQFLLVLGVPNLEQKHCHGWYPLHRALAYARICPHLRNVVWALIRWTPRWLLNVATPKYGDGAHSYTPLHFISSQQVCHDPSYNQLQLASLLLRRRSDPHLRGGDKKKRPLDLARDCNKTFFHFLHESS